MVINKKTHAVTITQGRDVYVQINVICLKEHTQMHTDKAYTQKMKDRNTKIIIEQQHNEEMYK